MQAATKNPRARECGTGTSTNIAGLYQNLGRAVERHQNCCDATAQKIVLLTIPRLLRQQQLALDDAICGMTRRTCDRCGHSFAEEPDGEDECEHENRQPQPTGSANRRATIDCSPLLVPARLQTVGSPARPLGTFAALGSVLGRRMRVKPSTRPRGAAIASIRDSAPSRKQQVTSRRSFRRKRAGDR